MTYYHIIFYHIILNTTIWQSWKIVYTLKGLIPHFSVQISLLKFHQNSQNIKSYLTFFHCVYIKTNQLETKWFWCCAHTWDLTLSSPCSHTWQVKYLAASHDEQEHFFYTLCCFVINPDFCFGCPSLSLFPIWKSTKVFSHQTIFLFSCNLRAAPLRI